MASWQRKSNNRVFVYYYDKEERKQKTLPREQTSHLDLLPDYSIDLWVDNCLKNTKIIQNYLPLVKDPLLKVQLVAWRKELAETGNCIKTIDYKYASLTKHVLPFFSQKVGTNPNKWPDVSAKMRDHLKEQGLDWQAIKKCNTALRSFWQHLCDERIVLNDQALRLKVPKTVQNPTPLRVTITPEQMLEWVKKQPKQHIRLIALLGYFMSIRPQEIYALRPCDFAAGKAVKDLDCAKVMERAGLENRLAVYIEKQYSAKEKLKNHTKDHLAAWVACFNSEAAKLIIDELNTFEDKDERIFQMHPDTYVDHWFQFGYPDTVIKDLRRASILWLGNRSKLANEMPGLRAHARHKKFDTTALYLRRPEEVLQDSGEKFSLEG